MRTKCCFSVLRSTISRPTGTIMAPPIPCRTRAAVNCQSVPLAAHSTEESVNVTIAQANTVRAPNRSVTQPLAGMNTATVSRYADIPMLRSTAATPNDCAIWGSAVAITVPSSCSMNNAPATSRAITKLWRSDLSIADLDPHQGDGCDDAIFKDTAHIRLALHFLMVDHSSIAPAPRSDTRTMTAPAKLKVVPSVRYRSPPPETEMPERDSFPAADLADMLDRSLHANIGRYTAGLSPAALMMAYFDWAAHIAAAPGKRYGLLDKAVRQS